VNVLPSERPQDVYSEIAAIVEQKRREDERNGKDVFRGRH
jgi:DNA-directed RNA polymerase